MKPPRDETKPDSAKEAPPRTPDEILLSNFRHVRMIREATGWKPPEARLPGRGGSPRETPKPGA